MELSERIDNNIWVSIDGELKQLRPLVAQLEAENERLRGIAIAFRKKIDDDCASSGCLCTFPGKIACSTWITKALGGE